MSAIGAPAQWIQSTQTDTMSDKTYRQFSLAGKFLTAPQHSSGPPMLILDCVPGEHGPKNARLGGYFNRARIVFGGAVLNQTPAGVVVNFRRDGEEKIQIEMWGVSTDGGAAFLPTFSAEEVLYGHILPPHVDNAVPVKSLRVAADEYLGSKIVAEFDIPDMVAVAETCGLVTHKR